MIRSYRKKSPVQGDDFLRIAWGIGGVVLIASVLIKALFNEKLMDLIGEDGALALLIGSGTQVVVSLDEELQKDIITVGKAIQWVFLRIKNIFSPRRP
ncbi:MAG: hypothetical protein F6K36_07055 [Symploca sp. SIO3C6]|nr:hypothetical protein [Symploca sp. SIO3C6]